MRPHRTWDYSEVVWGESLCDAPRCSSPGELLCDGELRCVSHADEELERVIAVELNPSLLGLLPPLYE